TRRSLVSTGKRRISGEEPHWFAQYIPVEVPNASDLAGVISDVRCLVIRQHVSKSFARQCFAVRRCTLFLQRLQRLRSKSSAKLAVVAVQRVEVFFKIERDGVDCFLGYRRGDCGHWLAALEATKVPFTFDSKMPNDHLDRVRLRENSPVKLVFAEVVE